MGEVYRARDTKLGRDVAIKILPPAFADDVDRLARFQREAQVLASLNHANIAAIYGVEESGGTRALVLELVDGPTLGDLIAACNGSGLPLEDTLTIARQIADALEAAHEHGIIHRDLKPANIKVRPDGTVKVLDFGLAKALAGEGSPNQSLSPTITAATRAGLILGTAAYMAPEQARGKAVDKRADIWAFGCVLYEMLTGSKAFGGEDVSDTLAFVITKEPDWSGLPAGTPEPVRKLLRRSLEKDRRKRLADIADARLEIDEGQTARSTAVPVLGQQPAPLPASRKSAVPWTVAAVLALGLATALPLWAPWRVVPAPAPVRVSAELGVDASLATDLGTAAVLSRDGLMLAFVAQPAPNAPSLLYVRRLDQLQARALSGTEDARSPFFSPDGQSIAFFAGGKLKRVSLSGGAPTELASAENSRGGAWADDGTIVFLPVAGGGATFVRVSDRGGKPESLQHAPDAPVISGSQRWPQFLPEGRAILYTRYSPVAGVSIFAHVLATGEEKSIQADAGYGRYLESGHLVFVRQNRLFAARFDPARLEWLSEPVPVVDGVAVNSGGNGAQFAVSDTGTLVFLPGAENYSGAAPIVWLEASGQATPLGFSIGAGSSLAFSPEGDQLALDVMNGTNQDIAVYDWTRGVLRPLTVDPSVDLRPVWTPDGHRIVFRSSRGQTDFPGLFWQRADGTGDVQQLTASKASLTPFSWHPNGKLLAFVQTNSLSGTDIMILPIEGDEASGWKPGTPTPFANSRFAEQEPMFSPDGKWLAFVSGESGRPRIWVRPFPGPGRGWIVSDTAGSAPKWSRTRQELFYTADERIMVVPYAIVGDAFRAGKPRRWADVRLRAGSAGIRAFDLHPDGKRVAAVLAEELPPEVKKDKVVFIFNFFEELRRQLPTP
jgi:serine/threonine-protein kinase